MKTKYTCTACNAVGDKPEIVEHCITATESTNQPHAVKDLKKQPVQVADAHARVARRATVRQALADQLGMPVEDIADALNGLK